MDGFELFRKYLEKHHRGMDFSQFDMEEVKKEVLEDRPLEATTEELLEDHPFRVATEGEVILDVTESIPIDLSLPNLP